jgi:hypothetical protein
MASAMKDRLAGIIGSADQAPQFYRQKAVRCTPSGDAAIAWCDPGRLRRVASYSNAAVTADEVADSCAFGVSRRSSIAAMFPIL